MMRYAPYLGPVAVAVLRPPAPSSLSGSRLSAADESALGVAIPAVLELASIAASTYHGYKRNNSVGWAIWWGLMGALFPIVTPVIALAQGFGKRAR